MGLMLSFLGTGETELISLHFVSGQKGKNQTPDISSICKAGKKQDNHNSMALLKRTKHEAGKEKNPWLERGKKQRGRPPSTGKNTSPATQGTDVCELTVQKNYQEKGTRKHIQQNTFKSISDLNKHNRISSPKNFQKFTILGHTGKFKLP
ncbi:hypothetical protein JRQ81_012286 [Phrynocephalus forsythii]|uniref:Uncharacterized protein n=1 Tax=Phrynocephalus forsythii TaxID=171643 RepID=A0A9Q1AQE4_9SAUR|nr:hypothetical protein JRQ81_012286 [Phrynocephalus forsythii]